MRRFIISFSVTASILAISTHTTRVEAFTLAPTLRGADGSRLERVATAFTSTAGMVQASMSAVFATAGATVGTVAATPTIIGISDEISMAIAGAIMAITKETGDKTSFRVINVRGRPGITLGLQVLLPRRVG